ncbi:hypothetical protein BGZ93_010723 [Podila epicladia]|nr:hypothetical protein BGZ92_000593 [Podila epicladia]KAG0098673.1 hypothetical protein BGZ93_010723 [Podila epicladia]
MTSSSRRFNWTSCLIPLAFLAASANAECVSLATSTVCPSYKTYSVENTKISWLSSLGINMSAFTDTKSFDEAANNATGFYTYGCFGKANTTHIAYQNTVLCTLLVQESKSCPNANQAPNLCMDSCKLYEDGLKAIAATACPNDSSVKSSITVLSGTCNRSNQEWPNLQSTDSSCVKATDNELATCGRGTPQARCEYCKTHAAEACCVGGASCTSPTANATTAATSSAVATTATTLPATPTPTESKSTSPIPGLSMAAFGGIIAGAAVLLLLIIAMCICCMRRKKTNKGDNGGSKNLSRQMSNSSARYNISSPKIQEEGFGASSAAAIPSAPIPMTALPSLSAPEPIAAIGAGAVAAGAPKTSAGKQSYCQALYPYQASMADELDLNPGDIVNVQRVFDDGWAVGVNMSSGNEGAFPVVCVMFVDESALDDDFEDVNMHSMTPMSVREDDATGGRNSPRSSLPSRSSSPVHLPRRNSSMLRDSTLLAGGSPMASSPLAGNPGGRSTPPVRDTMMSDASSINRWWDGEGRK